MATRYSSGHTEKSRSSGGGKRLATKPSSSLHPPIARVLLPIQKVFNLPNQMTNASSRHLNFAVLLKIGFITHHRRGEFQRVTRSDTWKRFLVSFRCIARRSLHNNSARDLWHSSKVIWQQKSDESMKKIRWSLFYTLPTPAGVGQQGALLELFGPVRATSCNQCWYSPFIGSQHQQVWGGY